MVKYVKMVDKMVSGSRPGDTAVLWQARVYQFDWVEELASGKVVALQVRYTAQPQSTVLALRELCGAHDPEIASHLHTSLAV